MNLKPLLTILVFSAAGFTHAQSAAALDFTSTSSEQESNPAGLCRRGIARAILADPERRAIEFGYRHIRLETGDLQRAALAFYQNADFTRTSPFGSHADDPVSIFFEKTLSVLMSNQRV